MTTITDEMLTAGIKQAMGNPRWKGTDADMRALVSRIIHAALTTGSVEVEPSGDDAKDWEFLRSVTKYIRDDLSALEHRVDALTKSVKDADVRLMPAQNAVEKHLRAVDGLVQRLLERVQALESPDQPRSQNGSCVDTELLDHRLMTMKRELLGRIGEVQAQIRMVDGENRALAHNLSEGFREIQGFDERISRIEDDLAGKVKESRIWNAIAQEGKNRLLLLDIVRDGDRYVAGHVHNLYRRLGLWPADCEETPQTASGDFRINGPIGELYARYDSNPRVSGPDDFEAFADAIEEALFDSAAPTPPVTGSADGLVEPKPQDGRRLENRVASLDVRVEDLLQSKDETRMLITDLQRQVETNNRLYGLLKGRLDGIDEDQADLQRQVRQLTAIIERHHELLTPQLMHPTPPQPSADDAEWGFACAACLDLKRIQLANGSIPCQVCSGPRVVDPEDEAQVRVVADAMPYRGDASENGGDMYWAKRILTALAELNGGAS